MVVQLCNAIIHIRTRTHMFLTNPYLLEYIHIHNIGKDSCYNYITLHCNVYYTVCSSSSLVVRTFNFNVEVPGSNPPRSLRLFFSFNWATMALPCSYTNISYMYICMYTHHTCMYSTCGLWVNSSNMAACDHKRRIIVRGQFLWFPIS